MRSVTFKYPKCECGSSEMPYFVVSTLVGERIPEKLPATCQKCGRDLTVEPVEIENPHVGGVE